MKNIKIIISSLLTLLITFSISAQSILQDHFNGNKDSLIAEATKLINMPDPTFEANTGLSADSTTLADMGLGQVYKTENHHFKMRDGKKIFAYRFPEKSQNTIILIHGVGSSAYLYNKTAGLLREATQAEVFAIDLRGHGQSEGQPGDVEYLDQYADDLTDIIHAIKKDKPKGKIILAGHSMGGGVILRHAMSNDANTVDGILFFAPLIGHNSPAFQQPANSTKQEEPFLKVHITRLIGLKMLNEIGNYQYDNLPVLFLNLPESTPLRQYTYRANMSMTPDDYQQGLQAIKSPLLVLVGSRDEVFNAEKLRHAILENTKAETQIIQDATHNGIRHNTQSFDLIEKWFSAISAKPSTSEFGSYSGISLKSSNLMNQHNPMIGGMGAFVLNKRFAFGGFGHGMLGKTTLQGSNLTDSDNTDLYLEMGYGGLFAEYFFVNNKRFRLSTPLKIGYGAVGVYADKTDEKVEKSRLIVLEPEVHFDVKISRHLAFGLHTSYRLGKVKDLHNISDSMLRSLSIGLGLKFISSKGRGRK